MGTFAVTAAPLSGNDGTNNKSRVFTVTGSASYATNGDTIDLSEATIGGGNGFSVVHQVYLQLAASPTASNSKYHPSYIPAAAYAAATAKIKLHDLTAAADAEVTNTTDLSAVVWTAFVTGR